MHKSDPGLLCLVPEEQWLVSFLPEYQSHKKYIYMMQIFDMCFLLQIPPVSEAITRASGNSSEVL